LGDYAVPLRFALAGISMDEFISLEIMRQAPERVIKLALLDCFLALHCGAADAQDVGAHQRSSISVREQTSPLARLSNSSIAPSFSARSRGLDDR